MKWLLSALVAVALLGGSSEGIGWWGQPVAGIENGGGGVSIASITGIEDWGGKVSLYGGSSEGKMAEGTRSANWDAC